MKSIAVVLSALGLVAAVMSGCTAHVVERRAVSPSTTTVVTTTPSATVITTIPDVAPCGGAWSPASGTSFGTCGK